MYCLSIFTLLQIIDLNLRTHRNDNSEHRTRGRIWAIGNTAYRPAAPDMLDSLYSALCHLAQSSLMMDGIPM